MVPYAIKGSRTVSAGFEAHLQGPARSAGAQVGAVGAAAAPMRGLQQVQGLLSFFEIRREAAADASAAGCVQWPCTSPACNPLKHVHNTLCVGGT